MKNLLFLLTLIICTGEMGQSSSWGVEDGVDWIFNICQDYLQGFIAKCGRYAVKSALTNVCEDLEFHNCQRVAQEVRDSYGYQQYYCENLGSIFYQVAKGVVKVTAEISWYTLKTTAKMIGCTLYYSGYALTSGAQYLLE